MSKLDKIIPHYTVDDWQHWEGSWELIDGHPIAMSPSPVPLHQRVAAEMRAEIIFALRAARCKRCIAYDPLDYVVKDDTVVIPDIAVVCGEIKKKFLDFAPVMIVEILSPSTALRDRNTKFTLYEQQGVKFYLIVDAERRNIEVFERNDDNEYRLREGTDKFRFQLESGCVIQPDFSSIFVLE